MGFVQFLVSPGILHIAISILCVNLIPGNVLAQAQIGGDIDGEAANDWSGRSVSMSADGSRVAIGAPANDGSGPDAGHVRVYDSVGGRWTQVGADIDGEAAPDRSGESVSLSADGSRVAIGAYANDGAGTGFRTGHVRVYDLVGDIWTKVGADIDGEAVDNWSGRKVSMSADGSRVAIGAFKNDGSGLDAGHVRVYDLVGGSWTQVGADIDGEAAGDQSGDSVSLSADGSRVAIGAYGNDGSADFAGHVRVYDLVAGGVWTQVGADIDGEALRDYSGRSVSLSADGSRVAIGANGNDGTGTDSGHVRVYDLVGASWVQVGQDVDGEEQHDNFGRSVSLSADGSRVAIGARGGSAGRVRVYDLVGGIWTQLGANIDGEALSDYSGNSVSLSADGSRVAIGASLNDGTGTNAGHVRVYDPDPLVLNLTVFLAGPHIGGGMHTGLNIAGFIPLTQPYDLAPFNYAGSESLIIIPADMVDWVLVELRSGVMQSEVVGRRVGILSSSGHITDLDGGVLKYPDIDDGSYYVVVYHRNHLAIMSANPILVEGSVSYDFTGDVAKAFGTNPMRDIAGEFVMWGGDGNSSGGTTAFDFLNEWLPINGGVAGYYGGDFNMSSTATAFDFLDVWLPANGMSSQVP